MLWILQVFVIPMMWWKKSVYKSQGKEIVISWKSTVQYVDRFTVEYGTKADFSDAITGGMVCRYVELQQIIIEAMKKGDEE